MAPFTSRTRKGYLDRYGQWAFVLLGLLTASGDAACDKVERLRVGQTIVWQLRGQPALFYRAGMTIDADGAPKAYHPVSKKGLDALGNAGRPGNWWGIATHNGKRNGQPVIQGPNDPAPGYYVSTTALSDPTKRYTDPHRYVDATTIPYIIIPGKPKRAVGVHLRDLVRMGDFVLVVNRSNGQVAGAIVADIGPVGKLGEGSIALAEALGIPSDPRRGGTSRNVVYILFPNSGNRKPRPKEVIEQRSKELFEAWGGMKQVNACFP